VLFKLYIAIKVHRRGESWWGVDNNGFKKSYYIIYNVPDLISVKKYIINYFYYSEEDTGHIYLRSTRVVIMKFIICEKLYLDI